ncbi:MAG: peptide deformylase [Gammaproteobacteria bacterium]|nr:peptide deformylase [Gammaproteobacteria bacterium]
MVRTLSEPSVLLLGDTRLESVSAPVLNPAAPSSRAQYRSLHRVLAQFRARHGFGRAIAAPQIGIPRRFIAADLGAGPFTLINPVITFRSAQTFSLWDDCMSFPDLLVRVRRHTQISVEYQDETGELTRLDKLERAMSELFQHEIDHLDGVLAVHRAVDENAVIKRADYERDPQYYDCLVD